MEAKTTPKSKRYSSVLDLVKATAGTAQATEFEAHLAETHIVRALIRSRAAAGMTQAEVAQKMNCTQSAVSKVEHSHDGDLTIREIATYLGATNGRLGLGLGRQPSHVDRIKEAAMCLKHELEALADLSSKSDDASIRKSVQTFFGEAWFNLSVILYSATSKLPEKGKKRESRSIQVINFTEASPENEIAAEAC